MIIDTNIRDARSEGSMQWLAAGWCSIAGLVSGLPAMAVAASLEAGDFAISHAAIEGFAGVIEVETVEEGLASLVIEAGDDMLDGFELIQNGDELLVRAPETKGPVSVVTGDIRGDVTINGRRYGPDDPLPEPARMRLTLVRGTSLDITGLSGEARLDDLDAPLHAELLSATLRGGRIGEAVIRIEGSGRAELAAIDGDAWLSIPGSGSIRVEGGKIGALMVEIDGAGSIEVLGHAGSVEGAVRGAGDIRLGTLENAPRIEITGIGRVVTGIHPDRPAD